MCVDAVSYSHLLKYDGARLSLGGDVSPLPVLPQWEQCLHSNLFSASLPLHHHLTPFLKHNSFHREQYLAVCLPNFSLDCKDILSSIIPSDSPDSWLLSKLTDFLVGCLSCASYFQPYYTTTSVTPIFISGISHLQLNSANGKVFLWSLYLYHELLRYEDPF